jgi:2-polyprenyl-3-methyl-5-hydroxy-6-metoxy-1,4-benzoquinol methylase
LFSAPGFWNFKKCPNPRCGLLWLDPMPAPEDIGKAYENYFTHSEPANQQNYQGVKACLKKLYLGGRDAFLAQHFYYPVRLSPWQRYAAFLFGLLPRRRELQVKAIMWLPWTAGGKLLDVGCGNGTFLARMKGLGWQVAGVEVDPKAVTQARAQGLIVYQGRLEEHNLPDNEFDAITMSHVIEHVHDPLSLLKECHRVLKPRGHLVITTPNPAGWGHGIFRENWRGLEPPRHLFLFPPKAMATLVRRAGFNHFQIRTSAAMAPSIFLASREISRQGRYDRDGLPFWAEKIKAWGFGFWEQFWKMKRDPDAGEELVVMARKGL